MGSMTSFSSILGTRFGGTFFDAPGEALKFSLPLDGATRTVIDKLISAGFQPLVVGGAVRDSLLGKSPKDIDIEVHGAESFDELRDALSKLGPLNLTGKSFGVLKLRVLQENGKLSEEIDLALPRRDSKTGEGHRGFTVEVDAQMSLLEATSRRDLTVNALVWDPSTELVIDLNGGLADMEAGVLRHVSSAFSEDPLRVLRVARFAGKLGFTPAEETVELSRALLDTFEELATERITGELAKLVLEPHLELGFNFLRDSGWASKLGLPKDQDTLNLQLRRGLQLGKRLNGNPRILQLALIADAVAAEGSEDPRRVTGYFAASQSELKRALSIAGARRARTTDKAVARQWAWDHQSITAHERLLFEEAVTGLNSFQSVDVYSLLGVLTGPEADRFDAQAVISAHKAANPGLKDGPWIKDRLQEERSKQYAE